MQPQDQVGQQYAQARQQLADEFAQNQAQIQPGQSALQSALSAIGQGTGAVAGAGMTGLGAVGAAGNAVAQALKQDPRYQTAIQHIGNFLSMTGHPLADAFNNIHGIGQPGQVGNAITRTGPAPQGVPGQNQPQGNILDYNNALTQFNRNPGALTYNNALNTIGSLQRGNAAQPASKGGK